MSEPMEAYSNYPLHVFRVRFPEGYDEIEAFEMRVESAGTLTFWSPSHCIRAFAPGQWLSAQAWPEVVGGDEHE